VTTWLPAPLFPAALAVVLAQRLGVGRRRVWLLAGVVFALLLTFA
jgi:hypothetical protein